MAGPETIVGGDMEDEGATLACAREGSGIAQIAGDDFDVEVGDFARRAHEGTDLVAAFGQESGDVPAHKSGSAGDERWSH